MPSATKPKTPWPELELETGDGRRQRSDRSRRRIIEAMFALISEGEMTPSAADVAERAQVGLRTVFRHFEDMDSIYNEMTQQLLAAVIPKIKAPYKTKGWCNQLMESVDRRADLYETIFPMRVCMALRYYQSEFIREQYDRDLKMERSALKAILPKAIAQDKILFAALETVLSFVTWRRLRSEQNLSVTAAKDTMTLMINGLIAGIDAD